MKRNYRLILALSVIVILAIVGLSFVSVGPHRALANHLKLGLDIEGGVAVVYEADQPADMSDGEFSGLMNDTLAVLDRRINSFGLVEPQITKQGTNRIRVELPGYKDMTEAAGMIGQTAILEFYQLAEGAFAFEGMNINEVIELGPAPVTTEPETGEPETTEPQVLKFDGKLLFQGDQLVTAGVAAIEGKNVVTFELNDHAAKLFSDATREIVETYETKLGSIAIVLDDEVISAPMVSQVLTDKNLMIEGNFSAQEAILLSNLIKGGALPLELKEVQTNLISATLGYNALDRSVLAGLIGFGAIALFMILRYRLAGVIAMLALALYASLTILALIALGATLTLPGIAGMILSVGMAVDANVIIFERLREELGLGKTLRTAVRASYHRAMSAIIDSNVTTLVAGIILYFFGEGPIKGFAITLSVGIVLSMLTAILVTRFVLNQMAGIKSLSNPKLYGIQDPDKLGFRFDFYKHAKYFAAASVLFILIGLGFFITQNFNYGVDFTGGTLLNIDFSQPVEVAEVNELLKEQDLEELSIITAGEANQEIILKTTTPLDSAEREALFGTIQQAFGLSDEAFLAGEQFGPAIGQEISRRAIISIGLATLAILAYVSVRFKLNYGIAAVAALVHDTLALLAIYAIFRTTVSSSFIAAILTIVGYSINDTIVIFDKIRENLKLHKKDTPEEIANLSIRQTMTRSLFTSLTTFFVILMLYLLGVSSVREFAFPLLWGTLVGAYSSIFIAGPLWVYLNRRGV
ncbi:MAG TPA: protein translocase subunit SecD [Tissierellia bacterium]|nr:protein translocase subunit SecD [Tissierellia bacterium]